MKAVLPDGSTYTFPDYIALDDADGDIEIPTVEYAGQHGETVSGAPRVKPIEFSASGVIIGIDQASADQTIRTIRGKIYLKEIKLYRYNDAAVYIPCYVRAVKCDFQRGKFGGKVLSVNITFEAYDPFFRGEAVTVNAAISGSNTTLTVTNPGTVDVIPSISFDSTGTSTFSGTFLKCGSEELSFRSSVIVSDTAILTVTEDTAKLDDADVTGSLSDASLIHPFTLKPGDNIITVYGASKTGTLLISFTPRYC